MCSCLCTIGLEFFAPNSRTLNSGRRHTPSLPPYTEIDLHPSFPLVTILQLSRPHSKLCLHTPERSVFDGSLVAVACSLVQYEINYLVSCEG
jgi:hypothetical protein